MSKINRVQELMALVEDGEATENKILELTALLREDPTLLEATRKQSAVHAQLSVVLEDEFSTERCMKNIMHAVKESDTDYFVQGVNTRLNYRRWLPRMAAVAAVILISLVAAFYFTNQGAGESIMATVTRVESIHWSGDSIREGAQLAKGQSVKIDNGMLEIDLAGRGRLIVEGPAHLDFPEEGHAILHQGRIVMRATEKGRGYKIETPQGNIIDLGTEFGVSVGADGLVKTHVIEGSVEAIPNHGKRVTLVRNDAMKMGPDGGEPIVAEAGQFYTLMPPEHQQTPKFIHWSFNEAEGQFARSKGELASTKANQADMIFYAINQGAGPSWVEGPNPKVGSALSFDGLRSYAESGYRGIGGAQPRTVCFWLKVPDDFSVKQGFGIVSWGKHSLPGEVWQLSVNPLEQDGPIGRLRLGLEGGQVIGSSDLRDGKWHHIGVVMYGGSQPNVGTHVILYVDGEQERLSRRALQEVRTEIDQAKHGVWLGRNVTHKEGRNNHPHGGFFRGELDELYIFDAALSQTELLHLMEDGWPDK